MTCETGSRLCACTRMVICRLVLARYLPAVLVLLLMINCASIDPSQSVRKVDYREMPEMKAFAEQAARTANEVYPRVRELFVSADSSTPRRFALVLKKQIHGNVGQTRGTTIFLNGNYYASHPEAIEADLVHEMAHVAQNYGAAVPGYWGEGMADYVCFKLGYTNSQHQPLCTGAYPHFTSGYCCAGAFLLHLDETFGREMILGLHQQLQRGTYTEAFFLSATGKSLNALWTDFQNTPFVSPDAKEILAFQQSLGYVNGIPPDDLSRRFEVYLKSQPGGDITLQAVEFLKELWKTGRLPGLQKLNRRLSPGIDFYDLLREIKVNTYPALRTVQFTRAGDASIYHYTLRRASKDSPWKLTRAWQTGADGRILEEFTIQE